MSRNVQVHIGEAWVNARVVDELSVQFTAICEGTGTLVFRFYADKNDTWRDAE